MPATALALQFGMLLPQEEADLARRRLQQQGISTAGRLVEVALAGGHPWIGRGVEEGLEHSGDRRPVRGNPVMKAITQKEARGWPGITSWPGWTRTRGRHRASRRSSSSGSGSSSRSTSPV
jgi:hypothetical protein